MTEPSKPRGGGRRQLSDDAEAFLEQQALTFTKPVLDMAHTLAAAMTSTFKALLRTAYLRGCADMMDEVNAARREHRPVDSRAVTQVSTAKMAARR